jgi:ABC-type sugar transport system ATPase subunit
VASVHCDHLVRQFTAGVRALDDVSLEVGDGELVVLVGPSGCGKSTLLRIVAGLETADSGSVRIGDRDVTGLTPPERNVAMVFQDYALYPHMTVRRNLEFPLRIRGDSAAARDEKIARTAAMLDLAPLLDRLPKELSGGQRQRVAMGRALVREPAVSLLDEPLSNLDAKLRGEVRAEIADLQRRTKTTMIYVTHDQVEAMTLGQRVAVLDRGMLMQVAPPAELYEHPANAFVAGFVGNPPMNLLPVSAVRGGFADIRGTGARLRIDRAATRNAVDRAPIATFGIRPENLSVAGPGEGDAIDATVDHVEILGYETLIHAVVGAVENDSTRVMAIARVPGTHRLDPGAPLRLRADADRVYLFDEAGRSLRERGA